MEKFSKEQRSKIMSAIRSTNTKDEVRLAKTLWHLGYRYRKNNRTVFGKPDLTFKKLKIAIFVDSEFFHGKDWETQKDRVKTNTESWQKKIERNIQRDVEVNNYLEAQNWKVIRFWSHEIEKNLENCIAIIQQEIILLQKQGQSPKNSR
jgi:DNA mismatch endonuclease (patch repair protein)